MLYMIFDCVVDVALPGCSSNLVCGVLYSQLFGLIKMFSNWSRSSCLCSNK